MTHLDLSGNFDLGSAGTERLAGVLGQCRELVHLNLFDDLIRTAGEESFAGVLTQCTALDHLDLGSIVIGAGGAERLAGVLGQCAALAHLDLRLQSDRTSWGRESCRSSCAVRSAGSHRSPWQ